jgi:hypothetical protein
MMYTLVRCDSGPSHEKVILVVSGSNLGTMAGFSNGSCPLFMQAKPLHYVL